MWHVLAFLLHLSNDSDIAMEHIYCTVSHILSSHGPSPTLLLHHCACEALYSKDSTACLQVVSLKGGDEDAIHFCSLYCSLLGYWWSVKFMSVCCSVIGGKEEQRTYVPACY